MVRSYMSNSMRYLAPVLAGAITFGALLCCARSPAPSPGAPSPAVAEQARPPQSLEEAIAAKERRIVNALSALGASQDGDLMLYETQLDTVRCARIIVQYAEAQPSAFSVTLLEGGCAPIAELQMKYHDAALDGFRCDADDRVYTRDGIAHGNTLSAADRTNVNTTFGALLDDILVKIEELQSAARMRDTV